MAKGHRSQLTEFPMMTGCSREKDAEMGVENRGERIFFFRVEGGIKPICVYSLQFSELNLMFPRSRGRSQRPTRTGEGKTAWISLCSLGVL